MSSKNNDDWKSIGWFIIGFIIICFLALDGYATHFNYAKGLNQTMINETRGIKNEL